MVFAYPDNFVTKRKILHANTMAKTHATAVNRKKKYSDFGKMKCSKFGNKSAVFSGTILQ